MCHGCGEGYVRKTDCGEGYVRKTERCVVTRMNEHGSRADQPMTIRTVIVKLT